MPHRHRTFHPARPPADLDPQRHPCGHPPAGLHGRRLRTAPWLLALAASGFWPALATAGNEPRPTPMATTTATATDAAGPTTATATRHARLAQPGPRLPDPGLQGAIIGMMHRPVLTLDVPPIPWAQSQQTVASLRGHAGHLRMAPSATEPTKARP